MCERAEACVEKSVCIPRETPPQSRTTTTITFTQLSHNPLAHAGERVCLSHTRTPDFALACVEVGVALDVRHFGDHDARLAAYE